MSEEDLSCDSLQESERNNQGPVNSVDDLLRQKLATRLKHRKKGGRSVSSNSSSLGNFEDHDLSCSNSDISNDERLEVFPESYEDNSSSDVLCSYGNVQNQDYDIIYMGASRSQKRQKFNNHLGNRSQENATTHNHSFNISPRKCESFRHKNQFRTYKNKPYTVNTNQSSEPTRREKKGSFEYLNDILDSYLLLPIAAEKLKECDIDVSFSIKSLCKGLCKEWTENGICDNENCAYTHDPKILFERKIENFSSLNITAILLYIPKVQFDLEISIAGFQELIKKERGIPEKWIERLVFYIFTKNNSLKPYFMEFWYIVAKYFCIRRGVDNIAYGFLELLNIIFNVKEGDRWKVIKFLKNIRGPPLNLHLSYRLLKPILHFDIPLHILMEVIQTCIETQVDVVETFLEVFPKIFNENISLKEIEILLKFSEILSNSSENYSEDLNKQLESKISTLSEDVKEEEYPLLYSYLYKNVPSPDNNNDEEFKLLIEDIVKQLEENFNVDFFAISINKIKLEDVKKAVETIMSVVFSKQLSPQHAIDLVQAAVLNSQNKSSERITAILANSLIYDYVTSQDWETSCSILTICCKKDLCLPFAEIIKRDLKPLEEMSQAKLAFLLAEIFINNQKYEECSELLERYNLLHVSSRAWSLTLCDGDNRVKVHLIDLFFESAFADEAVDTAYNFFFKIYKSQDNFYDSIDLRTYVSELIISLINQDNEASVEEVRKIFWQDLPLKDIAVRSLLAFLVQKNRLEEAINLFPFYARKIYKIPPIIKTSKESPFCLRVPSVISDEELYLIFHYFLSKMMKYKFLPDFASKTTAEDCKFNVTIEVVELKHDSNVKPWYLMEIINTEDAAIERVRNILEKKIVPPIKTCCFAKLIFADCDSVHAHLLDRFLNVKSI